MGGLPKCGYDLCHKIVRPVKDRTYLLFVKLPAFLIRKMHAKSSWQNQRESSRLGDLVLDGTILKDATGKGYYISMTGGFRQHSSGLEMGQVEGICGDGKDLSDCIKFG
jgi:hypothetical protein